MKDFKHKLYCIEDVVKKLGIDFKDLKREFNECGIKVKMDDKVTGKTLEYVLSGMTEGEYNWGNHLHLETGEAKGEIEWKGMRGNEGDEMPRKHSHALTLSGRASKLGVDESVIRNELSIHGWKIGKNDIVNVEMMSKVISGIELHESREGIKDHADEANYTHEYNASSDYYGLSEMALHLGVPATTLYSWMVYNKGDVNGVSEISSSNTKEVRAKEIGVKEIRAKGNNIKASGTKASCSTGSCSSNHGDTAAIKYGKSSFLKAGVAATALGGTAAYAKAKSKTSTYKKSSYSSKKGTAYTTKDVHARVDHSVAPTCDTGACATTKKASKKAARVAHEGKEITSGVVASGTPTKLGVFRNMHTGLAWGLLGFLAVPLLAGFFLDTRNGLENYIEKSSAPVEVVLQEVAVVDNANTVAEMGMVESESRDMVEKEVAIAEVVLEQNEFEAVVGNGEVEVVENVIAPTDYAVEGMLEHKASTKNFIDTLIADMDKALPGPVEHGVALPSTLPETGVSE